ncbi:unnamed protein product [Tetraodon nigroviridis]|uniref:(spotted green pufferfish) hypothetical protein n=1 Tax=Tetraodon nigroviridis TaxID=99883 RepID=Q4S3Q1_TETNG|nr:unnamed protein product [Tetraodon nigroviridis]
MSLRLPNVYHISAFSWYAYVVKSLADRGGQELPPGIFVYGGPWKYLTFLNLLLQMFFFGLAAVNDLQPHPESALNRCKDFLFSVFVFPVGMHTFVFPVLFGEILMQPHTYPRTKHALVALTVVGVCYLSW